MIAAEHNTLTASSMKAMPPCITMRLPQAAKALGVSERTLWQWSKDGIVPSFKIGGVVLFAATALSRFVEEQCAASNRGNP